MDAFTKKLIEGSKIALKMAESLISTPTLINTDLKQGAKYALPILCETVQQSAAAEVSESLVISTDAKKQISDNVAPGSRSWRLTGYIPGLRDGEPTNKYQPFLQFNYGVLWDWFNRGAVLVFKDGYAQIFKNVVIKDLQTSQQKDAANAIAVSMTIKEINILEMGVVNADPDSNLDVNKQAKSMVEQGSAEGQAAEMGGVSAEEMAS